VEVILHGALTEDLKRFNVPALILHGDDDQNVPIGAFSPAFLLIKNAQLTSYKG